MSTVMPKNMEENTAQAHLDANMYAGITAGAEHSGSQSLAIFGRKT